MKRASEKETAAMKESLARQVFYLGPYEEGVQKRARQLSEERFVERLWQKDGSLWKEDPRVIDQIKGSLGWLDSPLKMASQIKDLYEFSAESLSAGIKEAVLMGMGGSSLAPLLFARTFRRGQGGMPVQVLDTTDPATVLSLERSVSLSDTLFMVASKSGTTAEPDAFDRYFFKKMEGLKGASAGGNFAAITDPGSPLEAEARKRCFAGIVHNFKDIGGRYSALSYFGLLPATLLGLEVEKMILRAIRMAGACRQAQPITENPGVMLGVAMGDLALRGMDKLTLLIAEPLGALGLWLEQLIAESLGKEGKGILPVAGEPAGLPSDFGEDRFFIAISAATHKDLAFEKTVDTFKRAGRPVIVIRLNDLHDVTQEFFRFEIATATAGRILGVNPFDQPNVQESKDVTKQLLREIESTGKLTEPDPSAKEGALTFFGGGDKGSGLGLLRDFFSAAQPSDYVALQAYLTESSSTTELLQEIRAALRRQLRLATTMGYGPRFLHSTGQFHKGGPNTGIFLQFTADDPEDAPIPGTGYTFGILKKAQAVGDMEALRKHGRRIVRIHLGSDVEGGLRKVLAMIRDALS